jgi:hypothetical protein
MTCDGLMVVACIGLLMVSKVNRVGPLTMIVRGIIYTRASFIAAGEFVRAGTERVSSRWLEYLERAREL